MNPRPTEKLAAKIKITMSIAFEEDSDFTGKNYVNDKSPLSHLVAILVPRKVEGLDGVSSHGKKITKKVLKEAFSDVTHGLSIVPRPIHIAEEDRVYESTLSETSPVVFFPALTKLHDMNLRINITGESGSGKSFFCGQMIALLQKRKKRQLFVISMEASDNALDVHKPIRINMDDDEFKQLKAESFKDSLVVFDDIDGHHDKKTRDYAMSLRDSLLKTGRHFETDIISVSHEIRDRIHSRTLLSESTHFVFFPQSNMRSMLKYFEEHRSYKGKELQALRQRYSDFNQGRWVIFHKKVPQYFLTEVDLRFESSVV